MSRHHTHIALMSAWAVARGHSDSQFRHSSHAAYLFDKAQKQAAMCHTSDHEGCNLPKRAPHVNVALTARPAARRLARLPNDAAPRTRPEAWAQGLQAPSPQPRRRLSAGTCQALEARAGLARRAAAAGEGARAAPGAAPRAPAAEVALPIMPAAKWAPGRW